MTLPSGSTLRISSAVARTTFSSCVSLVALITSSMSGVIDAGGGRKFLAVRSTPCKRMSTYVNVRFVPLDKSADAKANETLLDAARRANVPLGNSCGGIGICARCRVQIVDGAENLIGPTSMELRIALDLNERLACQAVVLGNCSITTSYW